MADTKIESFSPQALLYGEVRKRDGSEYGLDLLQVMQVSIDRYLRQLNHPDSIISEREFKKFQATLIQKENCSSIKATENSPTELSLTVEWTKTFSGPKVN